MGRNNTNNDRRQRGATLVLSLLLMSILTLFAVSAMQSSHLSFKTHTSRTNYLQNLSELNQYQARAVRDLKAFIDSKEEFERDNSRRNSDGLSLISDLLSEKAVSEIDETMTRLFSYSQSDLSVDIYISQSRMVRLSSFDKLNQFSYYETHGLNRLVSERKYLYLQLHCIGRKKQSTDMGPLHIVSDFRFEV